MNPKQLLEILSVAEKLKCNTRHCDTSSGRRESVAEHSWRITLMAMLLTGIDEYNDINMDRVIRMCLIHDLGEAFTGDIPTFLKSEANEADEEDIFDSNKKKRGKKLKKKKSKYESPFAIATLKPIQMANLDLDEILEARREFTKDEWITLLLRSAGYEPDELNKKQNDRKEKGIHKIHVLQISIPGKEEHLFPRYL